MLQPSILVKKNKDMRKNAKLAPGKHSLRRKSRTKIARERSSFAKETEKQRPNEEEKNKQR